MPRRGVIALVITTFALVLLLNFKTPSQPGIVAAGVEVGGSGQAAVLAPVSGNAGPAGQAGGFGDPAAQAGTAGTQGGQGAGVGGSATAQGGAAASQAPAKPKGSGQVTGPVVATPYGDVQVQVTLSSGKIVDVQAIQLPTDRRRSQMISQYVAPVLRSEALQAQSAQIDLVSGATYTSEGYAQSLQAALDQAHG